MANYHLSIITPNGKVFDEQVESMVAPGQKGSLGVLAYHAPMVTLLGKGLVQIRRNKDFKYFAIESGILEVAQNNEVLILSDMATPAEANQLN